MQALVLFMLVAVTTFEFFSDGDKWGRWSVLPGWMAYLPELLSIAAAVLVVVLGARSRFQFVRPAYWVVFGMLVLLIVAGALVNDVAPGPVFAGLRNYLRALPWFLLPAVIVFSEEQVRRQLFVVLVIALVQLPLAIQQVSTSLAQAKVTGDWTIGSVMASSALTIFMISSLCVLTALFVRRRIRFWHFMTLFLLLLVPTTINETKVTILLLPIGLSVAVLVAARADQRLRYVGFLVAIVTLAAAVFVPAYDKMMEDRPYALSLGEFFSDPRAIERYVSTTDDIGFRGKKVGRLDSIVVPVRRLSADPVQLAFGYGIGNVSHSALGRAFTGRYNAVFEPFLGPAFSRLVLEIGILGVIAVLALMWMLFRDSTVLAASGDGFVEALGAGVSGVIAVVTMCIFYSDIIANTAVSFLFWYLAGIVAAARMGRYGTADVVRVQSER